MCDVNPFNCGAGHVHIIRDPHGLATGEGIIEFDVADDAVQALQYHQKEFGVLERERAGRASMRRSRGLLTLGLSFPFAFLPFFLLCVFVCCVTLVSLLPWSPLSHLAGLVR
jgi:hypothetical protein